MADGISSAHDLFPETSLLELSSPGTCGVCCQDITKLQFCCRDDLKEGLHEGNPFGVTKGLSLQMKAVKAANTAQHHLFL